MKERAIHGGREWSERDRGRKGGTEKDAEIGRQCEREKEERERDAVRPNFNYWSC